MISLLERGHLDGERLRQMADDILTMEPDGDPEFHAHVARRVENVVGASYAVTPVDGAHGPG